jgi:hypothetical protein
MRIIMVSEPAAELPRHDNFGRLRRIFQAVCILMAVALLAAQLVRLAIRFDHFAWWWPAAFLPGMVFADLLSGLVHWTADTWGCETLPIVGRRLVHPFRVHHVNPDDFVRRRFIDTNGDVAMLVGAVLAAGFLLPLESIWGRAGLLFLAGFSIVGLPANQVHQWAHVPWPPRTVKWLQDRGILLSRLAHEQHHAPPFDRNYCIATGWCNRFLTAGFFRRLERLVSRLTGIAPRDDDRNFHSRFTMPASPDHDGAAHG